MSTLPILAKPSGVTLADHTRHLHDEATAYFVARPFAAAKYLEQTGEELEALIKRAIDWHDQGKRHLVWQAACRLDKEEYDRTNGKKTGSNLRKTGVRHEMHSLLLAKNAGRQLEPAVRVAVAAHHGKLSHRHADRWQTDDGGSFAPLWSELLALSGTVDYGAFDQSIIERYRFGGTRALLQLFDHRASATESGDALPSFEPFTYTFPHEVPRGVQAKVAELYDEPVGILRAPTGSGKTDAALLWARCQIENGRADRLVIAMPTRFTASALATATAQTLSSTGLYHSSAWVQRADKGDLAQKEHELARLLETPVTVTTIDHLCICLTGRREDHHAIFWGLANACLVIDESDFYDAFTQANIVVLLRALRLLNVRVLIMSATIPDSFRALYARAGAPIKAIVEDTEKADEPRCRVVRYTPLVEKPEDVLTVEKPGDGKVYVGDTPLIIYANTVARAQRYYTYLITNGYDTEDVVLYHSRFTETDKKEIEKKLLERLGKDAWKDGSKRGIAVLTQIGELSVNISADRMVSDLAPLDRLVQRIGRLSRFGSEVGEITLLKPAKNGTEYPAPYGTYRTGQGWTAADALTQTDALFVAKEYTRAELVMLVDDLYPAVADPPERVNKNRRQLEENSVGNWLIVPQRQMAIDADEDEEWSCRDIAPQRTVYAQWNIGLSGENSHFQSWTAFREYAQPRAINLPVYIFKDALTNSWVEEQTITIGDGGARRPADAEKIFLVTDACYDETRGVVFPGLED
jgi:CRISPR-associated endonuclease/helicase Cas3